MAKDNTSVSMIATAQKSALTAAQATFGMDRVYVAGDHWKHQFGLPIPALPLKFLIGMSAWPLQRITQSQGPEFSCKSAFIFQLERWILEAGGLVHHVDTENKVSSSLLAAMMPERFISDPDFNGRFIYAACDSINAWQKYTTDIIKGLKLTAKQAVKNKPTHLVKTDFMTFVAVDSMMGTGSEESSKYVQKHGEAQGRTFSDASLLIANYFREMPNNILGWPITVHFSHHEKVDPSARFGNTKRHAGGVASDFMATLDLVFSLGWAKPASPSDDDSGTGGGFVKDYDGKTARPGVQGRWVTVGIKKNSEGPAIKRRISVPFIWRYENADTPEGYRQVAWWDWDTSLVDLCIKKAPDLGDLMKIEKGKKGRHEAYFCTTAGVSADDPLLPHELGEIIHANKELSAEIEKLLYVNKIQDFGPDIWKNMEPPKPTRRRRTSKTEDGEKEAKQAE